MPHNAVVKDRREPRHATLLSLYLMLALKTKFKITIKRVN